MTRKPDDDPAMFTYLFYPVFYAVLKNVMDKNDFFAFYDNKVHLLSRLDAFTSFNTLAKHLKDMGTYVT